MYSRAKNIFFISSLLIFLVSFAKKNEEMEIINRLIQSAETHLVAQKNLRDKMLLLQEQEDLFLKGNDSQEHLKKMITTALEILQIVQEEKYEQLFPPAYLKELELFAHIDKNRSIRKS